MKSRSSRPQLPAWLGVATLAALSALALAASASVGAWAGETHELYRGARAMAMGGAFTALADDEQAIFFNPAGMAGNQGISVNVMQADIEIASGMVLEIPTMTKAFSDPGVGSLNALMGKDIYMRGQLTPSLTMPNFGVALISDHQMSLGLSNQAMPNIELGFQQTNGIQAAFGISIMELMRGRRRANRFSQGDDLRIGLSAKLLWRRGGYRDLSIIDMMGFSKDTLHEIAGNYEMGYGADFGTQYIKQLPNDFKLMAGLVWQDFGDTSFAVEPDGTGADPIKSSLNFGLALGYRFKLMDANLVYDYRHILNDLDWRKRSHLGLELKFPIVSVYGGINQVSFTYGAGFDFWLIKVMVLSYGEEMGVLARQHEQRRWLVHAGFSIGL